MDLTKFDRIIINTSAGKDSQAMLDHVVSLAALQGVTDRLVAVHCDLGRVEWRGTRELAEKQVAHYGVRFIAVSRPQGDLLDHVESRGMWPGSTSRYCTSDHKRGQVEKVFTLLAKEWREAGGEGRPCQILNCMGMRHEESAARAKLPDSEPNKRASNNRKQVTTWHPIIHWKVGQVWDRIKASGVPHHPAYDLGMPRLSCVFCIFSPKPALMVAGYANRELLREYVDIEERIGHSFRQDFKLADVLEAIERGEEPGEIKTWGQQ